MKIKKLFFKKYIFLLVIIFISFYSWNFLKTQQRFDPTTVQSKDCQLGRMSCGFIPESLDLLESIPLAESTLITHRGLPSKVDFSKEIPPVANQGRQNSCVAFSTGYYTKSYYEYKKHKWKYDPPIYGGKGEYVFSPAYIYNQINGGKDRGSFFHDALNLVIQKGVVPWKYMPYNENDYLTQPETSLHQIAGQFKAKSYRRIPFENLEAIKAELASGNTIIFGMVIDDNFYQLGTDGNFVYDRPGGKQYGGHAMTLVGYDDNKRSSMGDIGAFKLVNSWGISWGDKGYGWISYRTWLQLRPYVYVLYDDNPETISNELYTYLQTDSKNQYLPSPANISASKGLFKDKIVLTWNPVSSADVYGILRLDPGSSEFKILGYSYKNSYEDKLIQPNVTYFYTVISISAEKTSDPNTGVIVSGYASRNTIMDIPKVHDIKIHYKNNKVYISWGNIPNIETYQVRKWDEKRKEWLTWNQVIKSNRFIDNHPLKNQINRYSIRGIVGNNFGEWSDPVEIKIPGSTTPPPKPTIIDVSMGLYRDKILIKWEAVEGADAYFIFRYDYSKNLWEGPFRSDSNEYVDQDTKIMSGEYFAYIVQAKNSAGLSDYSNIGYGNTNPNVHRAGEVLPPPKNLEIKMHGKKVLLEWEKVEGSAEYYIYRKKYGQKEYEFIQSVNENKYQEVFPGEEGELYFYVVRSKPPLGRESENSKVVVAFLNPKVELVTHRFMPGEGMERFLGKWKGNYWDGSSEIQNYDLEIKGENETMIVNIAKNNKKETYRIMYPALSKVVRLENFELKYKEEFDLIILEGKRDDYRGKVITFIKH